MVRCQSNWLSHSCSPSEFCPLLLLGSHCGGDPQQNVDRQGVVTGFKLAVAKTSRAIHSPFRKSVSGGARRPFGFEILGGSRAGSVTRPPPRTQTRVSMTELVEPVRSGEQVAGLFSPQRPSRRRKPIGTKFMGYPLHGCTPRWAPMGWRGTRIEALQLPQTRCHPCENRDPTIGWCGRRNGSLLSQG